MQEIVKNEGNYEQHLPGWHMNKAHWLSVSLDSTADDEKVKFLVDMSYELTKK